MFDARRFYADHGLEHYDSSYSHKHTRQGWTNRPCPFCSGNPGLHLGYNEKGGYYVCYRCGGHRVAEVIRALLSVSWQAAFRLQEKYGGDSQTKQKAARGSKETQIQTTLPPGTGPMGLPHFRYLVDRAFAPEYLAEQFGLLGTGALGPYKFRIIAPILFNGELVSYQGRDITDKQSAKYKACPRELERIHHKHIVYAYDMAKQDVLVVEGVTDVWRMGPGSVALFGIKFTPAQVKLLTAFRRVFVWFDEEDPEAEEQNHRLISDLAALGTEAESIRVGIEGDPGDLKQEDADYIMRELLIRR